MIPAGNIIDKSIFNHTLKVIGIRIPSTKTSAYLNVIGPRLLKQRNYKPIQKISESQRLVLLDPKTWPNQQSVLAVEPLAELIKADSAELAEHDIEVNYDSHDLDSALRIALPPDTPEIISSFETVGHLIHVNLKPWLLPYKYIIGRLILDVRYLTFNLSFTYHYEGPWIYDTSLVNSILTSFFHLRILENKRRAHGYE